VTSLLVLPFSFLLNRLRLNGLPSGLLEAPFAGSLSTKLLLIVTVPLPARTSFSVPLPDSSTKNRPSPRSSSLPNVLCPLTWIWNWVSAEQAHLKLSFFSAKETVPEGDLMWSVLWMIFGLGVNCLMATITFEEGG